MRKPVAARSDSELRLEFPIDDLVPGWFFRVQETSPGGYRATGFDRWSRVVEVSSDDPDRALRECREAAERIQATVGSK